MLQAVCYFFLADWFKEFIYTKRFWATRQGISKVMLAPEWANSVSLRSPQSIWRSGLLWIVVSVHCHRSAGRPQPLRACLSPSMDHIFRLYPCLSHLIPWPGLFLFLFCLGFGAALLMVFAFPYMFWELLAETNPLLSRWGRADD